MVASWVLGVSGGIEIGGTSQIPPTIPPESSGFHGIALDGKRKEILCFQWIDWPDWTF
jgi:hypothetical protein